MIKCLVMVVVTSKSPSEAAGNLSRWVDKKLLVMCSPAAGDQNKTNPAGGERQETRVEGPVKARVSL